MTRPWMDAWTLPGEQKPHEVSGLSDFMHLTTKFGTSPHHGPNRPLFRGVPSAAFGLIPTIARRLLSDERPLWLTAQHVHEFETSTTREFQKRVHLVVDPRFQPDPSIDDGESLPLWQLMQHYGGATRLLDWSGSPYVALYFAVCDQPAQDGAVWMIDQTAVEWGMHKCFPPVFDAAGAGQVPLIPTAQHPDRREWTGYIFFRPCERPDERMVAQSGWFSCATTPECNHGEAIGRVVLQHAARGEWARRIVVPAKRKPLLLRELYRMNVTHATLFPGLGGLVQSLARRLEMMEPTTDKQFGFGHGALETRKNA